MFLRERAARGRIQFSLVKSRRVDDKVRQKHVIGLGTVADQPTIQDRVEFWRALNERLDGRLVGLSSEARTKITKAIHSTVPIPSAEERRQLLLNSFPALRRRNAKALRAAEESAARLAKLSPTDRAKADKAKLEAEQEVGRAAVAKAEAKARSKLTKPLPVSTAHNVDAIATRVRAVLAHFDQPGILPADSTTRDQLVANLVAAIIAVLCGVKHRRCAVSDKAFSRIIFMKDLERSLEHAGMSATRWRRRYDRGEGPDDDAPESRYFKLAHELGDAFDLKLPQDLKLLASRAKRIRHVGS
jgi:hypothetical protein